jgi:ribosomal protein L12E/L44/L45/RPP1/RPP2
MGAKTGNQNAKKDRTRVSVVLSISDERLQEIIQLLMTQGVEPTDQAVRTLVKTLSYHKIDEELRKAG